MDSNALSAALKDGGFFSLKNNKDGRTFKVRVVKKSASLYHVYVMRGDKSYYAGAWSNNHNQVLVYRKVQGKGRYAGHNHMGSRLLELVHHPCNFEHVTGELLQSTQPKQLKMFNK